MTFAVLVAALALPGVALAQVTFPVSDVFWLDYFDNAGGSPDASVRITNPGTTFDPTTQSGDLCAMIYVYRPDQELSECCGCRVTPNGLLKLSVNKNLTTNPANGKTLTSGVIKIISALPTTNTTPPPGSSAGCDPGGLIKGSIQNLVPTPALRAWATHLEDTGTLSESAFQAASLSSSELALNQLSCIFIEGGSIIPGIGSGTGLCNCTNEASGSW
jgi:hypothetical protein